ncbi:MAG TPA: metallopeptidase TldD-related protein [Thermoanaerobaculia bacterium]
MDGRGEIRRLERSRLLYVTVDSTRPSEAEVRTCSFEGGRAVGEDGSSFVFSGPPPASWGVRLPKPAATAEVAEARRAVQRLVGSWNGRTRVQYLIKSSVRIVLGDGLHGVEAAAGVWALLGNAVTPSGRIVPVGQSGRGSGVAELERETAEGDFARLLDRVNRSQPLPGGATPAVLAPPAAGVLIHEAIGHFAEAAPEGRVDLSHRLGFRIAAEIFALDDDPRAAGGSAHYAVDDDGVLVRGATAVARDGRMLQFLHSAASARAMGVEPTGNARAASVWNPPIPRMSNLLCAPGIAGEAEMLDRMGDGLYLHSLAYGYGFGFRLEAQVRLAEEVRGGRRTGRYFSGGVIDEDRVVLTRAAELGDAAVYNRNAMCGKDGQLLYDVGTRAPAIRMHELRTLA